MALPSVYRELQFKPFVDDSWEKETKMWIEFPSMETTTVRPTRRTFSSTTTSSTPTVVTGSVPYASEVGYSVGGSVVTILIALLTLWLKKRRQNR